MDRKTDYSGDIIADGFYCLPVCGGLGLEGLEGRIGVSTAGWMDGGEKNSPYVNTLLPLPQ